MWYLCTCGKTKYAQPYKSNITKDWICPRCADKRIIPSSPMKEEAYLEKLKYSVKIAIKARKAFKK